MAKCCAKAYRTVSMCFFYFKHFICINSFNPQRLYEVGVLITSDFTEERAEDRMWLTPCTKKKKGTSHDWTIGNFCIIG